VKDKGRLHSAPVTSNITQFRSYQRRADARNRSSLNASTGSCVDARAPRLRTYEAAGRLRATTVTGASGEAPLEVSSRSVGSSRAQERMAL
jgi:hypothetical protein